MALFGVKTVDDALANLNKALTDLNTVKDALRTGAQAKDEEIARLQTERDDLKAEAERAQRIAGKLEDLLR